jgi:hypothetical protein
MQRVMQLERISKASRRNSEGSFKEKCKEYRKNEPKRKNGVAKKVNIKGSCGLISARAFTLSFIICQPTVTD